MSVKISVIIPVYNAEKYLAETLDSVLNQTFADFEVIAVNDGSKDNSLVILKEYEKKDKRVKVIDKKNTGVSDTRNVGIKNAVGEYICFVDSDDTIHMDYLKRLYEEADENRADIILCEYKTFYSGSLYLQNPYCKKNAIRIPKDINKETAFAYSMRYGLGSAVWNRLIRTNIIKKNNILFDKHLSFGEDMFFNWKCILVSDNVYILNEKLYFYRQSEDSAILKFHKDLFMNYKAGFMEILEFIDDLDNNRERLKKDVYVFFTKRLASFLRMIVRDKCNYKEKRKQVKNILNDEMFVKALYDYKDEVYQNEANHAVKMYTAAEKRRINTLIWCGIKYEYRLQWGRKIKGYSRKIKK